MDIVQSIMPGDITKFLSDSLRNLTIIEFKLKDLFFRDIVRDSQAQLLTSFSRVKEGTSSVAQYNALKDAHRDVDMALMVLKILGHFESGLTPLLILETNKNLLAYKQELVKSESGLGQGKAPKPASEPKPAEPLKKSQPKKNFSLPTGGTKEKIIALIEQKPRARSMEIIDELRPISPRTIKRNIKELLKDGVIIRRQEENTVYYSIR